MFTTITDEEREDKGVSQLPDSPLITSTELKALFDSLGNLAIDKFITHIEEISADTGSSNIGVQKPTGYTATGTLQNLLDEMCTKLLDAYNKRHIHTNKEILDSIIETTKAAYDNLVVLLEGIEMIDNILTDEAVNIPTSHAVKTYVDRTVNAAPYVPENDLINRIYPVGSNYNAQSSINPGVIFGGTWREVTWQNDTSGLRHFIREA